MCKHPVYIPNANYGRYRRDLNPSSAMRFKDCFHPEIPVPCGHCSECVQTRQMNFVQRCEAMSLFNHVFMVTLTYNDDHLPTITCSNGVSYSYADIRDLTLCIKRIRKANFIGRPFKYLACSERGSQHGRPHFHLLVFIPKEDTDDRFTPYELEELLSSAFVRCWAVNIGTRKRPIYEPLFTYATKYRGGKRYCSFDCHYVKQSSMSDASVYYYVTKYLFKNESKFETWLFSSLKATVPEEEYREVSRLLRSRHVCSVYFGVNSESVRRGSKPNPHPSVVAYITAGIKTPDCNFPTWQPLAHGSHPQPLCKYFKKYPSLYRLEDAEYFYALAPKNPDGSQDNSAPNPYLDQDYSGALTDDIRKSYAKLSRVANHLEELDVFSVFDNDTDEGISDYVDVDAFALNDNSDPAFEPSIGLVHDTTFDAFEIPTSPFDKLNKEYVQLNLFSVDD